MNQSQAVNHYAIPMPSTQDNPAAPSAMVQNTSLLPITPTGQSDPSARSSKQIPEIALRHPRQAPSTVVTERMAEARAALTPAFAHNNAAVKQAYTSSIQNEMPRFKSTLDLLA